MNVVRLMGGMGNQMFQYAFGRMQKLNGIDVCYDNGWYRKPTTPPRPYRLDKFNADVQFHSYLNQPIIKEKNYNRNLLKTDNSNFHGYWQYFNYYKNNLFILRKELTVKEEFYTEEFLKMRELITATPSISVHVRRGDYVVKEGFGTLPFIHFYAALSGLAGNIFIFSDDIEWCKLAFLQDYFDYNVYFIHSEDYLDFELMKSCKYNIISHSSYSWWAAILNNHPEKIVIAPQKFLVRKEDRKFYDNKIHYPLNWIKI